MTDPDHLLRAVISCQAFFSLMLGAKFFGAIWPERRWSIRIVCVGLGLVLSYVLAGQAKAFLYDIRFDAFSAYGVLAYAVLLAGLGWFHLEERRTRRGR